MITIYVGTSFILEISPDSRIFGSFVVCTMYEKPGINALFVIFPIISYLPGTRVLYSGLSTGTLFMIHLYSGLHIDITVNIEHSGMPGICTVSQILELFYAYNFLLHLLIFFVGRRYQVPGTRVLDTVGRGKG